MFGFLSGRRHRAELAAVKTEADRLRTQRDKAFDERDIAIRNRAQIVVQNAALHAANQRLEGSRKELGRRLDSAHDTELRELSDISALEARVVRADARAQRLLKVIARGGDALRASRRRADLLQSRLDDAVGLSGAAYDWRPDKSQRAKEDAS